MGGHQAVGRAPGPVDGDRLLPGGVGHDLDVVVPGGAAALRLDPADALADAVELLVRARPRQALGQIVERALETPAKALDDAALV